MKFMRLITLGLQPESDKKTYRKADGRGDEKSPVTAEMSIGNVRSQDRHNPNCSRPIGDIVGRRDGSLMQLLR